MDRTHKVLTLSDVVDILGEFTYYPNTVIHSAEPDYEVRGLCDGDKREIFISRGLYLPQRRETIIHELTHAREMLEYGTSSEKRVREITKQTLMKLYG